MAQWENEAYAKLENSETGVNVSETEDALYYLARIDGGITRLKEWSKQRSITVSVIDLDHIINATEAWVQSLRDVLDKDCLNASR